MFEAQERVPTCIPRRQGKRRDIVKPTSLIGLALLLAACGGGHDPESGRGRGGRGGRDGPVTVGYVVIQQGSAPLEQELPGRVAAYQISDVRPQVNGVILKRLFQE